MFVLLPNSSVFDLLSREKPINFMSTKCNLIELTIEIPLSFSLFFVQLYTQSFFLAIIITRQEINRAKLN